MRRTWLAVRSTPWFGFDIVFLFSLLALSVSCKSKPSDSKEEAQQRDVVGAAPTAEPVLPAGILAQLFCPRPVATWQALRELGALGAAPLHPELALSDSLGLPVLAAGHVDSALPLYLSWSTEADGTTILVGAVGLTSGREFIANLSTGASAGFRPETSAELGTALHPKSGPARFALRVLGNSLIFAERAEVAARFAQYASFQVLHPVAKSVTVSHGCRLELTRAFWRTWFPKQLGGRWLAYRGDLQLAAQSSAAKRGRPPDLGEPAAVVSALDRVVKTLADYSQGLASVDVEIKFAQSGVELFALWRPEPGSVLKELVARMPVGDLSALGELPAEAQFATVSYLAGNEEPVMATAIAEMLKSLVGARLGSRSKQLALAVTQLGAGLNVPIASGLLSDDTGQALFLSAPVESAQVVNTAMSQVVSAMSSPEVTSWLAGFLGPGWVRLVQRRQPAFDTDVTGGVFQPFTGESNAGWGFASVIHQQRLSLTAGTSALAWLPRLGAPPQKLSNTSELRQYFGASRAQGALALWIKAPSPAAAAAPSTLLVLSKEGGPNEVNATTTWRLDRPALLVLVRALLNDH